MLEKTTGMKAVQEDVVLTLQLEEIGGAPTLIYYLFMYRVVVAANTRGTLLMVPNVS